MTLVNIEALIQGIQIDNPRLYQILMELNGGLLSVQAELNPIVRQAALPPPESPLSTTPTTFTFIFTPITVRFSWAHVDGALLYEVRKGTVWETAAFQLRTSSLQADIDPLLSGTHTYLLKTLNIEGEYSTNSISLVVTVPTIGPVTISKEVIDNNVLLRWSAPSSVFRILNYEISKNGVIIGNVDSTFFTIFENVAGTYTYRIVSIDVAGNRGTNSDISVEVRTPPDYALQDQRTSALNGTRVNVGRSDVPSLVGPISTTETWTDHFVNNSWTTIQDQVSAGFELYLEPSVATGSYEEVIDYGVVINNSIATITFNYNLLNAPEDVAIVIQMATSTDGISYTSFVAGATQFIPTMRYLKFRIELAAASSNALIEIYNVAISLNVKRENDGGEVSALSSDSGGTTVNFTKAFKDIETITATAKSVTEPFVVIIDFNDIPNPVFFKIYVFDTTGNRVSQICEWKARGII